MGSYSIDTVVRLRMKHSPGQLAALAAAIAREDAVIGEVATLTVSESDVVREFTLETHDESHTQRVLDCVRAVEGVEVQEVTDRVFEAHRGGKLRQCSVHPLKNVRDLRSIYTPGVARVARAIQQQPSRAWDLTGIGNSVAILTNGTRVLGLGNIGPLASMPVMEGKAVLYDQLVGISATPILVDRTEPRAFVEAVMSVAPTFGAIHLEDIRTPDCFFIEDDLRKRLRKPVMHDDRHGTATVVLATLLRACKLTGTDLRAARVGQIGFGAAGGAIVALLVAHGVHQLMAADASDQAMARARSQRVPCVSLDTVMREADIVVATTGVANLIRPEQVQRGQIVLALSNPDPEIEPDRALAAGAGFAADGRSVNNVLAYPGLMRGMLRARCSTLRPEMMLVAAEALAAMAMNSDLLPHALDRAVHEGVAEAVAAKARELGLADTIDLV
jgi:malate dehydrogenase (oxaloacetate-decarboxylating)